MYGCDAVLRYLVGHFIRMFVFRVNNVLYMCNEKLIKTYTMADCNLYRLL